MQIRFDRAILSAFVVVALALVGLLVAQATQMASNSYTEGWFAYRVLNLLHGDKLYWPADAWVTNNYPPLGLLLVGGVARLGVDPLFAARIVSFIGFAACATFIGLAVRRAEDDVMAGFCAAACFAATFATTFDGGVGHGDPQVPGEAFMLAGLYLLVRAPQAPRAHIGAALLMAVGLFTKHNIIALPLTVLFWLGWHDRRAALRFAVAGLAAGATGLALCGLVYGADFYSSLATPRPWEIISGLQHAILWLDPLKPFAVFALLAAALPGGRTARLFALYILVATLIGVVALLGRGTASNMLFETAIAGALCAGAVTARLPRVIHGRQQTILRGAIIAAVAISAVFSPEITRLQRMIPGRTDLNRNITAISPVVTVLRQAGEPVLCEQPLYCYWAGRAETLEPFNYGQKVLTGHMDQAPLLRRIAAGEFKAIAIDGTPASHGASLYFAPVWDAILMHYRQLPGDFGKTSVFVPR